MTKYLDTYGVETYEDFIITIIDPCRTVVLSFNSDPFIDYSYTMRGNAVTYTWSDSAIAMTYTGASYGVVSNSQVIANNQCGAFTWQILYKSSTPPIVPDTQ